MDCEDGHNDPHETSDEKTKEEDEKFKTPTSMPRRENDSERGLPYIPEPLTSDPLPAGVFVLEIIKNGLVIERKEINKPRITFGRSKDADYPMEHPSLSRYHACLLWNPKDGPDGSFFLIDLNSVHGTTLNKAKIPGLKPIKINPGNDIIKMGASSRLFILNNTNQTEEDEDEEEQDVGKKKTQNREKEDTGCTWGFKDDMDEEDDEGGDGDLGTPLGKVLSLLQTGTGPGATQNEHAYNENPQKTIQHWFDSEGYDFEFKVDYNNGLFKCSIEIPLDGQNVTIDGEASSKKKDALVNVCLRACQVLDKAELLFPWQRQKDVKRKKTDSSDSDDEVMDETAQYKCKKAKKLAAKNKIQEVLNFESLNEKWKEISQQLGELKAKLVTLTLGSKAPSDNQPKVEESVDSEEHVDALDEYMKNIDETEEKRTKTSLNVKIEQSKLRMTIANLEKEQQRVERLLKIAKTTFVLPALESVYSAKPSSSNDPSPSNKSPGKSLSDKFISIKTSSSVDREDKNVTKQEPKEEKQVIKTEPGKFAISLTKKSLIQKPASAFNEPEEVSKPKLKSSLADPETSIASLSSLPPSSSSDSTQYGLIIKKKEKSQPKPKPKPITETPGYFDQEAYVEWLPPEGQTGDGKTALNEKYGY